MKEDLKVIYHKGNAASAVESFKIFSGSLTLLEAGQVMGVWQRKPYFCKLFQAMCHLLFWWFLLSSLVLSCDFLSLLVVCMFCLT